MKKIAIYKSFKREMVEIIVPPSKSHTMRALLFAAFGKKKSILSNCLISSDTKAMIDTLKNLGAKVRTKENKVEIFGAASKIHKVKDLVVDAKNSGIILRFIPAMLSLRPIRLTVIGDASIQNLRNVDPLILAIEQLKGECNYLKKKGFAPVQIKGPIEAGDVEMDGQDSQPVSAMLSACSFLQRKTTIHVRNSQEKPWIDLTLFWLQMLGASVKNDNYQTYVIEKPVSYERIIYKVPSDFSSAAFMIAGALVCNTRARIKGLDFEDIQGDKIIIDYLIKMGANLETDQNKKILFIEKSPFLEGGIFDMDHCIDAIPILAVLGCFMKNKLVLLNCSTARRKESNRLEAITRELRKMGANIRCFFDAIEIAPSRLHGADLKSYNDHRIAMALSIAALNVESGCTTIKGVECVSKTYPQFFQDLQKFGAQIQWIKT